MNSSNAISNSSMSYAISLLATLRQAKSVADYLTISLGILLNLWVLLAVLTTKDIRSRMRNKIVCSFCLLHLLNSLVFLPMQVDVVRRYRRYRSVNCHYYSALTHIYLLQDFISNWTLVLLMVIFVSAVCDYKPHAGFTNLATIIGTYALLALPWLGSLITIPVITSSKFYTYAQGVNLSSYYDGCIFPTDGAYRIIWWLDTTVPLLVAGSLLVTAVVLRRRRFTRGFANGMQVELIDRGPEIDDHYGYTAAVVVTLVCDFAAVFLIFDLFEQRMTERWIYGVTAYIMSLTKTFLITLPWLFFPDIRERLKNWRPWHCPKPGIDLTLVYKNTT